MQEPKLTELVKLYYRIGEVAKIVGVQPHVLRYWETEFRSIRPQKSSKGQRVYSRKDVERLMQVKNLLKNEGFTIAGARRQLHQRRSSGEGAFVSPPGPSTMKVAQDVHPTAASDEAIRPNSAQLPKDVSIHSGAYSDSTPRSAAATEPGAGMHAASGEFRDVRQQRVVPTAGAIGRGDALMGSGLPRAKTGSHVAAAESAAQGHTVARLGAALTQDVGGVPQNAKALRRTLVQVRAEVVSLLRELRRT